MHKTRSKDSFFSKILMSANMMAAGLLLLSYSASYISAEWLWAISFFGISYPVFLTLNFLFMLYWMISGHRFFLISLISIAIGYNHLQHLIQFNILNHTTKTSGNIKVMTYNVRLFDLYKLSENQRAGTEIFKLFEKERPDILCIQEFYTNIRQGQTNTIDSIRRQTGNKYFYFLNPSFQKGSRRTGIAVFSKFPIIAKGNILFQGTPYNTAIYCDIATTKDTVRLFNVHLQSIRFDKHDYAVMETINKSNNIEDKEIKGSKKILTRLKTAFIKRAGQADILSKEIEKSPYPVIICGDFNDTPSSYTYNTISNGLKDAFTESGSGLSKTYSGIFPSFRIDYILFSKKYNSTSYKVLKRNFSDHYPVISEINL